MTPGPWRQLFRRHLPAPVTAAAMSVYGVLALPVTRLQRTATALATAASHNTATSREVPLLAELVAVLSQMTAPQRMTERLRLLSVHEGLSRIEGDFLSVLRAAKDRSRDLSWLGAQVDHRLGAINSLDHAFHDMPGKAHDLMFDITLELSEARMLLYRTTNDYYRPERARPYPFEWEIVVHHLINVYGRRRNSTGGPTPRPLDALGLLVNDFRGADLRTVALRPEKRYLTVQLRGVRWDEKTRWPAGRAEEILAASDAAGPDAYEVRSPFGAQ